MGCGESPMRPPFKLGDLLAAAAAAAAAAVISSKDLCRSSQRSSRRWTAEERLGDGRKMKRRCNYPTNQGRCKAWCIAWYLFLPCLRYVSCPAG